MLEKIKNKYNEIMNCSFSTQQKNVQLSELMTFMENVYKIPMLNDDEFNKKYEDVMNLYTTISNSRIM